METQIRRLSRKGIAEFLGTFLLVLIGTGAIVFHDLVYPIGGFGISFCFFVGVFVSVAIFGKYSGAHINPAVSAMFYLKKDISRNEFIVYVIAQCLGAILASFVLELLAPTHPDLGSTFAKVSTTNTFIIELAMTYFLCIGILLFCDSPKSKFTGLVAAMIVFFEAYLGGPFTGASMNPARSLGPALVSNNLGDFWIYLIAPTIGAVLALISRKYFVFKSFS